MRADRLHASTRTYLLYIGSTFAAVLAATEWLGVNPAPLTATSIAPLDLILIGTVGVSLLLFLVSFVLTILVIKTWPTERLRDPRDVIVSFSNSGDRTTLLASIVADFGVAARRNGLVNDQKGALLKRASLTYRIGVLLLLISASVYMFT